MRSPLDAFDRRNLLTYVSLMCGLAACAAAAAGNVPVTGMVMALAVIADTFDGRFARLFASDNRRKALGAQLDSLADAATLRRCAGPVRHSAGGFAVLPRASSCGSRASRTLRERRHTPGFLQSQQSRPICRGLCRCARTGRRFDLGVGTASSRPSDVLSLRPGHGRSAMVAPLRHLAAGGRGLALSCAGRSSRPLAPLWAVSTPPTRSAVSGLSGAFSSSGPARRDPSAAVARPKWPTRMSRSVCFKEHVCDFCSF